MVTERVKPSEPKRSEPMSPAERGAMVGEMIDWTYDKLLSLPEAIRALQDDCRGPRFAVTPTPEAGRLSFIRNGYVVSLTGNRADNNPGMRWDRHSAKQSLVVEISPVVDVADSDKFLNFHAVTTHVGDPITDVITGYEDGELHIFPVHDQNVISLDKNHHDSSVITKTKDKISNMMGLEPVDQSETEEDMKHRLEHLT